MTNGDSWERRRGTRTSRLAAAVVIVALIMLGDQSPADAMTVFTRLSIPVGVATDAAGNVYVTSDAVTTTFISKYAPDGRLLSRQTLGGFAVGKLGKLVVDGSRGGYLYDLTNDGTLVQLDPNSLAIVGSISIRQIPVDTSNVYDVTAGRRQPFTAYITPSTATYTDLSLRRRGPNRIDFFVAGISNGFPFVERVVADWATGRIAGTVMMSSLTPNAWYNYGRGLVVRSDGLLMTTLPVLLRSGKPPVDLAVTVGMDYPAAGPAPRTGFGQRDVTSRGMTVGPDGRFYIAVGSRGSTLCGDNSAGAVLVTTAEMDPRTTSCRITRGGVTNNHDVAVTNASEIYTTMSTGEVLRIPK